MNLSNLPIPSHFDPDKIGKIWKVLYEKTAEKALKWAQDFNIQPAAKDTKKICLVAVDVQNTFCLPEFELYVGGRSGTGAVDDNNRLCQFIYRNLQNITQIVPTMDTHQAMQIFHSIFFTNDNGQHPDPFTMITEEDIAQGRWGFNQSLTQNLNYNEEFVQQHIKHYTNQLNQSGKYALTIWPYHAMLGGIGHALVPSIEEAIFFHTVCRNSQPDFQVKGSHPLTEHYSVFGPEVTTGPDGKSLVDKNEVLFQKLVEYDAIIIAGQAKSHCVAWTIADLLDNILIKDRRLAEKVYLLEDCSSPVVIPGVIDYTDDANAAFQKFKEAGMHVVQSTEAIQEWPGM